MSKMRLRDQREPGWFWADNELFDVFQPLIGPYGVLVYIALCRMCRSNEVIVSRRALGEAAGVSKDTVDRSMKKLVEYGMVAETLGNNRQASAFKLLNLKESGKKLRVSIGDAGEANEKQTMRLSQRHKVSGKTSAKVVEKPVSGKKSASPTETRVVADRDACVSHRDALILKEEKLKLNTSTTNHPFRGEGGNCVDVKQILEAMRLMLKPTYFGGKNAEASADLKEQVCDFFQRAGWDVTADIPIHDRGDGKPGKLDFSCRKGSQRLVIEVDRVSPRVSSCKKLQAFPESEKVIILRNAIHAPRIPAVDHVVAMGWPTESGKAPTPRALAEAKLSSLVNRPEGLYRPQPNDPPLMLARAFLDYLYESFAVRFNSNFKPQLAHNPDWEMPYDAWKRCFESVSIADAEAAEGHATKVVITLESDNPTETAAGLKKYHRKVTEALIKAFGFEAQLMVRDRSA